MNERLPSDISFFVEGFRAPSGVLNPDEYDPRIGMRALWGFGLSRWSGCRGTVGLSWLCCGSGTTFCGYSDDWVARG